jgi:cysteinyl-tRNA synthetase
MNVTNVDDKIIKRARQNHLYKLYLETNKSNIKQTLSDINTAIQLYNAKNKAEQDPDKQKMMSDMVF